MKSFWATARMCVRTVGYFGPSDLIGQYLLRLAHLAGLTLIWLALFRAGADTAGMTLKQALGYTALSSALSPVLDVRTPISSWLHEGTLSGLYQRPASIFSQLAAHTVGGWAVHLACYALPVCLFYALGGVPMLPGTGWFFLSLPLAISQGFAVDFLFACLLIRMRGQEWTVHSIRAALTALFTGALIPFSALPWGLGGVLSLSPLGTLAGAPLALFTGLDRASRLIPAQILWNLTLWPLAAWWFNKSHEEMALYGG